MRYAKYEVKESSSRSDDLLFLGCECFMKGNSGLLMVALGGCASLNSGDESPLPPIFDRRRQL